MTPTDTQIQKLLDKAKSGTEFDRNELINRSCSRLLKLTRKMFHNFKSLQRWEQTDDVFQNALVRLHRSLLEVQVDNVRHFFNLAALQIRRELLDLTKHYYGKLGMGSNHHSDHQIGPDAVLSNATNNPIRNKSLEKFHENIDTLPAEEQEVINMLFYEGFNQEEPAEFLGISLSTVKRRWHAARIKLAETF
jgi:RNA polymerase sigma-70 factor (ECF subfamily)